MSRSNYDIDRLPPAQQLRLYADIALRMVRLSQEPGRGSDVAMDVAAAAAANVQDAIALLQEHRVPTNGGTACARTTLTSNHGSALAAKAVEPATNQAP